MWRPECGCEEVHRDAEAGYAEERRSSTAGSSIEILSCYNCFLAWTRLVQAHWQYCESRGAVMEPGLCLSFSTPSALQIGS